MFEVVFAQQLSDAMHDGAAYAEVWFCSECPNFVAAFDDGDQMVACYPLPGDVK